MSKHNSAVTLLAVLFLSAVVLLSSCTKEAGEQKAPAGGIPWLASMDEALQQAGKNNRPIMIDVYADWCVWCKRLDSDTYSNGSVVAKAADFVNLKLDADANRSIVQRYQVGGLPTILFLDPDGREIHRVIGYKPPDQFIVDMETALAAFKNGKG
jgi:thiol:disulfide interchange protein DsbD